jgi:hypothetical protein
MTSGRPIVDDPEAALAELTQRTRPPWLKPDESLPFEKLTGDEFEVFCYQLVCAERPGRRVFYYGRTADGGRDVMAETADGRIELIQCKCFSRDISVDVVRADLAKVFTNIHLGIIPKRPDRIVFYAAPKLSPTANDLLMDQGQWRKVGEAELRKQWTTRKLEKQHGSFPQALLDLARDWWPEPLVVPGIELTRRAEQHPELIEKFFALRSPPNIAANEELRHELLMSREQLSKANDRELKRAEELFEQGNYQGAADFLLELLDELAGGATPESCTRRVRARLHLVGCWINLRDHAQAKAVFQQIRMTDLDRAERTDQLRYARMRLMLDHSADVSRWSSGDDARPLRQTQATLRGQPPEEPIDHPDVLLLAAGTALFDGRLNAVVRYALHALDQDPDVDLFRAQFVQFLALAVHQTLVEGGSELIPIEERGPLLERIERELEKFAEPLHPPTDRVVAQAQAIYARMALVSPMEVPLAEEGGKALPTAEWFPRLIETCRAGSTLADLEALAQAYPGRALIEAPLAEALVNAGRVGEGIRRAHEAVRLLPCHRHHFLLAGALVRAGRIKEAWHFARHLPFEREPAFVGIVARLLVAVVPGSPPLDERQETLRRLRACSPHDPFLRLAEGFLLANHGHFSKGADAVWQGVQSLWAEGAQLEVPLLKEVKKLQGYAEQRGRRWKELARRLLPLRADPVAESLYVELYYDLEQPADLRHPDLGKLVDAGYARFTQADDILTLIKLSGQVRELWSKGDLPSELPDLKGIPSAFELVDEITQGRLRWSAPVELLPLENPELLAGAFPDQPPPDTVLLGLFEFYLLAEADGLGVLLQSSLKVATFRDCIEQLRGDEPRAPTHTIIEEERRKRLEARRAWHRFVWPNEGNDIDEATWARDHDALLIRLGEPDESEGTTPESLVATLLNLRKLRPLVVPEVEAWLQEAGAAEPLATLAQPHVALAADVVTHRVVDLLDVLPDAFWYVMLTPQAAKRLEAMAQASVWHQRAYERWVRARDGLEQLRLTGRLVAIARPMQAVGMLLPEELADDQSGILSRALSWHEALVDQPTWRILSEDRFTHGLFTIFAEPALLRLLGGSYDLRAAQTRLSAVRSRVATLSGHLAQMGAPPEALRRLARLGAKGLARFPEALDPLLREPDEVALDAMEASARHDDDAGAAWLVNQYAAAALRNWQEGPDGDRPKVLARVIERAAALDRFAALLIELMGAALMRPEPDQVAFAEAVADEVLRLGQGGGALLRAAFSHALVPLESESDEPSFALLREHAVELGAALEQRLAFNREPGGRTFRGIIETLAVLSGQWPDSPLAGLLLGSDQGGRLDAETVLRRAAHSTQLAFFKPWLLEAQGPEGPPGLRYRVAIAPGALLLRMEPVQATGVARFLVNQATGDDRLRRALIAFADQPEAPSTRRALAIAEASSPVRLFAHHPEGFAQWGKLVLSSIGFMSRLDDFRVMLSEVAWADEESGHQHIERLVGKAGSWTDRGDRGALLLALAELPGEFGVAAAVLRLKSQAPEETFRESLERLANASHLGAGQIVLATVEGWLGAIEHPEVVIDGSPVATRERFVWALEGVLAGLEEPQGTTEGLALVAEASTGASLAGEELGLLRLCRHIVARSVGAAVTPWYEVLWLSWRLHVWLLHQLDALDPAQRQKTIEELAAVGRAARLDRWRCHFDPATFTSSRELRAVQVLGALAATVSHIRETKGEMPFSPLSEKAVGVLIRLASQQPTTPPPSDFFPLFPWSRPFRVPELALMLLAMLHQDAWPKLAPDVRLRWLDRLTREEGVLGLSPLTGWFLFGNSARQSTEAEIKLAHDRLVGRERPSKVEVHALLAALAADPRLAMPADLDDRIRQAADEKTEQHFLALRLEIALARAPETFETIARSYFAQAPDPIPLAQGLSLLVTRPEPEVAQAARALVATLSKEATFCNDPRMQTLFDLTGVT